MTEPETMTIETVIQEFATADGVLPRAAMQWAGEHWDEAAPRFLDMLSHYANGSDRSSATTDALLFIVHLFGEKREARAFTLLCRLMQDDEASDAALGDAVTTTLRQILVATFDGDTRPLRTVIEDSAADDIIREGAMMVMAYLARTGRIPEADMHAYLRHLLVAMQPQSVSHVWAGWVMCAGALGMDDLVPDVKRLFERRFIDPMFMGYKHFEKNLRQAQNDPGGTAGFEAHRLVPFASAVDELSRWYSFSEERRRDEQRRAEQAKQRAERGASRVGTVIQAVRPPYSGGDRNPMRHVGRNDPCPCGSGRKFKKCCLGKAELVPEQAA